MKQVSFIIGGVKRKTYLITSPNPFWANSVAINPAFKMEPWGSVFKINWM
jgi:hypothetical protein